MKKLGLHSRPGTGVGHSAQYGQQFSGAGFAPDLHAEGTLQSFPEANKTMLEEGVYGSEGMMPAPGFVGRPLIPGYPEGGTGGAGSFVTRQAAPRTRY